MQLLEITLLIIISIVFLLSIIGCFVPIIPSAFLAFIGILTYKLILPESPLSWNFVITAGILTLIVQVLDFLCTYWGVKKFGATWKGGLGATIGVFVGMFIPPIFIWIFLAPVIFATLFELLFANSNLKQSLKAGFGAFIGCILSTILKLAIVIAMIIGFFSSFGA
ncbi:MAG: DUF456 domain-containing protein [Opitutales bacterium]